MPTGTGKTHSAGRHRREFFVVPAVSMDRGATPGSWWSRDRGKPCSARMSKEDLKGELMSIQWAVTKPESMDEERSGLLSTRRLPLVKPTDTFGRTIRSARKLGMTATPRRLNGKGFTDLFDSLITFRGPSRNSSERGWLSSFGLCVHPQNSRNKVDRPLKQTGCDDHQVKGESQS